jgi:endoribonuclease Dicer
MLEAIIGAIYVSEGSSADGIEEFYRNVLKPFYERYVDPADLAVHPTRKLTNIFDAQGCRQFEITKTAVAEHSRQFTSEGDVFQIVSCLS